MARYYLLSILIFASIQLFSQDIDIYQKKKNGNYELPKINKDMSLEEFQLLAQNVRMKDMLYGIIVPGHIHFKAKSRKMGFWLLGIRTLSYATIGGVYLYVDDKYPNQSLSEISDEQDAPLKTILYTASITAVGTYIFDLIHGEGLLKRKQENIRYKYALKLSSELSLNNNHHIPQLGIVVSF